MINTYNETRLHETLKTLYQVSTRGECEAKVGGYVADVLVPDGSIIEIQTANLSSLKDKIAFFLSQGRSVKVVYPLPVSKTIETHDETTGKTIRRKSPIKKNIFSLFRELTGFTALLLDERLTIEVLEADVTEERVKVIEAVQSQNNRRRVKKDWLKTGKRLDALGEKSVFCGRASYERLLPKGLPPSFCKADFYTLLCEQNPAVKVKKDDASLMLWVYEKIGLVECTGMRGKAKLYRLSLD